jgi:hypothetical protein
MAAIKVATGLGYGVVTFLFLKNAEGIGAYTSELARTSIHFFSAPRDRLIGRGYDGRDLGELGDKLDKLASMRQETVHVHHGDNGWSGWVTTVVGGTVCVVVVAHVSGLFDMSGIMYVTQSKFKTATEALKEGVDLVSKALAKARVELLEKIGVLEKNLEETKTELKNQIVASSEAVRDDVAKVSLDVKDVGLIVGGLESKLGSIEGGVGDLHSAVEKANRGIQLLCHVVADSYRYAAGNQRESKLYAELMTFTKVTHSLEEKSDPKQIKENGEGGPVMRLISSNGLGGSADNGGGLASFRETLNRQLSGVLDV